MLIAVEASLILTHVGLLSWRLVLGHGRLELDEIFD